MDKYTAMKDKEKRIQSGVNGAKIGERTIV